MPRLLRSSVRVLIRNLENMENPGFYEPPLTVLRMFWLTSAEKKK